MTGAAAHASTNTVLRPRRSDYRGAMQSRTALREAFPNRALATAVLASSLLFASGCCCSPDFFDVPHDPMPADSPRILSAGTDYVREHRAALFASPDAGPGSSGECSAVAAAETAMQLGAAVVSRGHSGERAAGSVTFNPLACARRIVVWLIQGAHAVWNVVGAVVYDRTSGAELLRFGTPLTDFVEAIDADQGSDETF